MKNTIKLLAQAAAILGALIAVTAARADAPSVNAVVDVTAEGRNAVLPSPERPVYFYPFVVGYEEVGAWDSENLPSTFGVLRTVARALATQGYLVENKKSPPALLLTFRWGRMAPHSDFIGVAGQLDEGLATLVGGYNKGDDITNLEGHGSRVEQFRIAASERRYFLVIEAFDFNAAEKKDKIPLWCARISTDANGTTLAAALPSLASGVAPLLGQDIRPRQFVP